MWRHKETTISSLRKASDNYLAEVYSGLSRGKSVRDIHKAIRRVTEYNLKRGYPYDKKAETYAVKIASKAKKRQPMGIAGESALSAFALDFLQKEMAFEATMSISFEFARKQEGREKEKAIEDALREAEKEAKEEQKPGTPAPAQAWKNVKMFYIASEHQDCAEDHKDYQGRLYYDRFWRRYVKDARARKRVESFIERKKLRSIQWVIGRPVWLITRPNCRHYFEQVTIEEAMGSSAKDILNGRDMSAPQGRRGDSQTIRHETDKGWYTEQNVRNIIKKYKERLAYHQALYAKMPNEKLKGYIDKDKRLIRKWESYLRSKF